MAIITDFFTQAELALAAYANLTPGVPRVDALIDEGRGMSFEQATRFSTQWTVAAQYNHSELIPVLDEFNQPTGEYTTTSNGLSVTVFQDNAGTKYLAIRGTDDLYDLATDLVSVAILGSTRFQAQYQSLKLKVQEWIGNGTLPAQFTVTGHSLGGFLATGLASEFSANVSHAYLYNSPGIGGIATATELGQRLLTALNITASLPGPDKFSNTRADAGVSPIAGLGLPVSPPIQIAIENQFLSDIPNPPAARNHSQQTLTDALAVYAAYAVLAPSLNEAQITRLLKSAFATNKGTLEGALDALRKTLLGAAVTATAEENRESLYTNLYALQSSQAYANLRGSAALRLTATQGRDQLVTNSKSDFGHFLAVKYLLPVAIEGAVGTLSGVHADLYTQWQADKLLTPEQRKQGQANFTDEYLTDRAAFLTWKNRLALEDATAAGTPYTNAPDAWFRDYASGLVIHLGATGTDSTAKPRYLFGADQASGVEMLEGGSNADRIYGGAGEDRLYGNAGRDYLEGNAGDDELYGGDGNDTLLGGSGIDLLEGGKDNDTLKGGAGLDTYAFASGDGWDWIEDSDGLGIIRYDGIDLAGGENVAANVWKQTTPAGKTFLYSLDTSTENNETFQVLTIQAPDAGGGIRIRRWQPGQLGIVLGEAAPPLVLPPGSIAPATRQTAWYGEDHAVIESNEGSFTLAAVGDYGEVWGSGQLLGNGSNNLLHNGEGDDELYGLGGRDSLIATGGNDRLFGGDDDDVLHGGDDDDLLEGGEGSDVLAGGSGADVLLGGEGGDFLFATGSYHAARSDWSFTYDAGTNTLMANQVFGSPFLADAAADLLRGGAGNDFLFGGEGADQLFGEADDDRLEGAAGDDYLSGGDGADVLRGDMTQGAGTPAGASWFNPPEYHGNDILDGGAGDDRLYGAGGADEIYGGEGDDELSGDDAALPIAYQGADFLDGGAGNDRLWGYGGNDRLLGGIGDDTLAGDAADVAAIDHGHDILDGEEGNDTLNGDGGDDELFGGEGNDRLFGDGDAIPLAYQGDDYLVGGAGDDYLHGHGGDDTLIGGEGIDELLAEAGNDALDGGAGDDVLDAGEGDDTLIGGAGDDGLLGGAGKDTLTGGAGADNLWGEEGDDVYVFNVGDGQTNAQGTIEAIHETSGNDTVRFGAGISPDAVEALSANSGAVLLLRYGGGDQLAIVGGVAGAVENFEFADGTRLSYAQLIGRTSVVPMSAVGEDGAHYELGGRANDTLTGLLGRTTLAGGRGDDTFIASGGNNTYLYEAGDGSDSITDISAKVDAYGNPAPNVLRFGAGIRPEDIRLFPQGGALVLDIGGGDAIRIENFDGQDEQAGPAIDRFEFADDTFLDYQALLAGGIDIEGSAQDDIVDGTVFGDRLCGHGGDDVLIGRAGDDTLTGGTGDDVLQGGMGSDTYVFNPGDGRDTVIDGSGDNQVVFGTGLNAASIQVSQNYGEDGNLYLDLDFGDGDRMSVLNGELRGVQSFRFADGTVIGIDDMLQRLPGLYVAGSAGDDRAIGTAGDDRMQGAEGNDVLDGRGGNDRLDGGRGEDTLVGGDGDDMLSGGAGDDALAGGLGMDTYVFGPGFGHDTLAEQSGEVSELRLMPGMLPSAMDSRREGDDLLLSMKSGNDSLRISGYYSDAAAGSGWTVRGADGMSQSMDDFLELVGLDSQGVSEAMEQFRQRVVADWGASLAAQGYVLGDDRVARRHITQTWGAQWNPHFESIDNIESIEFRRADSSGGGVFIERYEEVGPPVLSVMSTTEIRRADGSTRLYAADTLAMSGEDGSDRPFFVPVAQGNVGGYRIPYGAATMILKNPNGGIKGILVFPPAMPPQSPAEGTNQTETVSSKTTWRTQYGKTIVPVVTLGAGDDVYRAGSIEIVDGGDGNDWIRTEPSEGGGESSLLYGNDGDDTLITAGGGVTGNTLIGGRGRDRLFGDNSADTYLLLDEDAVDTVIDLGVSEIAADEVRFGAGVTAASLRVLRSTANVADLADVERLGYGFLAGSEWLLLLTPDGTGAKIKLASADSDPGRGIEYVSFADGSRLTILQLLARLDDSQTVLGSRDDDTLILGTGNDVIDGGAGDDVLSGGAGNDVYVFGRDGGTDRVDQGGAGPADADVIRFAADVRPGDVSVSRDGTALRLTIDDSGDAIVQEDWFATDAHPVLRVEFGDGTVWETDRLLVAGQYLSGTGQDDLLSGSGSVDVIFGLAGDDEIDGGAGDDQLSGGEGNDVYLFSRGSGMDHINQGDAGRADIDAVRFADGIAPADVSLSRAGNALHLTIDDTGEAIVQRDWYLSGAHRIARVEFADGTVWRIDEELVSGTEGDDVLIGGDLNSTLDGLGGNDVLDGGTGHDRLAGGHGNDVYLFGRGGGVDAIDQSSSEAADIDTIRFAGDVLPSIIEASRVGNSLRLAIKGTDDALVQEDWFAAGARRIARIEFADGTVWNSGFADHIPDRIIGTAQDDLLHGTGRDDIVRGFGGNDLLDGQSGSDELDGGAGDDVLDGGRDWDKLAGGAGNDVYLFRRGGGMDIIDQSTAGQWDIDAIRFADDVLPSAIQVSREGDSLLVTISDTGDTLVHTAWFGLGVRRVALFEFADGTVWDTASHPIFNFYAWLSSVSGTEDADHLWAGFQANDTYALWGFGGEDILVGSGGNDVLDGGRGRDWMDGGGGGDIYLIGDHDAIDDVADSGDEEDAYRTWFYRAQGIQDAAFHEQFGGQWLADDGTAQIGFESRDEALDWAIGLGLDSVEMEAAGQIRYIVPLPHVPAVAGNDYAAIDRLVAEGVIRPDRIVFGPGVTADGLAVSGGPQQGYLSLRWPDGKGVNIHLRSDLNDMIGNGIERVEFEDGSFLTIGQLLTMDQVVVGSGDDDYLAAAGGNDSIDGQAGNDNLYGDEGSDRLDGGPGDDYLEGNGGDDRLSGGEGSDTYFLDASGGHDAIVETAGVDATDAIYFGLGLSWDRLHFTRYANGNDLVIGIDGWGADVTIRDWFSDGTAGRIEELIMPYEDGGNWYELRLSGADLDAAIWADNSAPALVSRLDDQQAGMNQVFHFALPTNAFVDSDGDRLLYQATLVNGDPLPVWLSFDPIARSFSGTPPSTSAGVLTIRVTATDAAGESASDEFTLDIANHLAGTADNDRLTGTAGRDVIEGFEGNDVLNGAAGADTLIGGTGNDTYYVDNGGDIVSELVDEGTDRILSTVDYALGDNVENLTLTGMEAISGTGNALNNTLVGNAASNTLDGLAGDDRLIGGDADDVLLGGDGNDVLNGSGGADTMTGGAGNDTYYVNDVGDAVMELADEGADRVISTVSYALGDNVENLTLSGTEAIDGTGNALNNVIVGNAASNRLDGLAGDDRLTGGASDDVLLGGEGNDVLNGAAGADAMAGGLGNDIFYVDDVGDAVTELADEGTDRVISTISYALGDNVENLTLSGTAAIDGTGNALNNTIVGNATSNRLDGLAGDDRLTGGASDDVLLGGEGNDVLNGAAGADAMAGGLGNDTYYVDDAGDTVAELADEGSDRVISTISYTLGENVENITLTGTGAIDGAGNALDNALTGNAAINLLAGGDGVDRLNGGAELDFLEGGAGNDVLVDTVGAGYFNGGSGNDSLRGDGAADFYLGGAGNDSINTGTGADVIVFNLGDGQDTVAASIGADNTLSLGGGIAYSDITFRKSGNHLVLDIGASDHITLANWYASTDNRSVLTLQVIAEAMADFDSGGADPLRDDNVESFDFTGMAGAFDAARAANPGLTSWAITNAMTQFHLAGSDTAALGGDLAYQYGRNGTLAGIGLTAAQEVLGDAQFGVQAQTLRPLAGLQDGAVRLG
jgi:Ca2+-binding RTX toxin-like protein